MKVSKTIPITGETRPTRDLSVLGHVPPTLLLPQPTWESGKVALHVAAGSTGSGCCRSTDLCFTAENALMSWSYHCGPGACREKSELCPSRLSPGGSADLFCLRCRPVLGSLLSILFPSCLIPKVCRDSALQGAPSRGRGSLEVDAHEMCIAKMLLLLSFGQGSRLPLSLLPLHKSTCRLST